MNVETWEMWSYVVTVIGLPLAILAAGSKVLAVSTTLKAGV